jgi:two-component system LytT family response regulator
MLRALIIDDEPPARDFLRRLLVPHAPSIEIAGEARSVTDAADKCAALRPDLLFLDVQMPREDGFALLPRLAPPFPAIIFVTAYDHFAVRAFEVNAIDYLLKPLAPARLAQALARLTTQTTTATQTDTAPKTALLPTDSILVRSDTTLRTTPVISLTHIEAEENYTRVHFSEGSPLLVRRTMAEWESLLPSDLFVRIDRSLMVNLIAVRRLETCSRDIAHAHLAGRREPLVLARRASLRLRRVLTC